MNEEPKDSPASAAWQDVRVYRASDCRHDNRPSDCRHDDVFLATDVEHARAADNQQLAALKATILELHELHLPLRLQIAALRAEREALASQALEISICLSDAGIGPCSLAEGVRELVRQRDCAGDEVSREATKRMSVRGPSPFPTDKHTTGLVHKFNVERTDGTSAQGQKHDGCDYFVLDLTHDPHAQPALRAYADSCRAEYPLLARDLDAKFPSAEAQLTALHAEQAHQRQILACPICLGRGHVPHGFYTANAEGQWSSSSAVRHEGCRSCQGRGVIETALAALTAQQEKP